MKAIRGIEYRELTDHWQKTCMTCKEIYGVKDYDDMAMFFHRDKTKSDGFYRRCKSCQRGLDCKRINGRYHTRYKENPYYHRRYAARYKLREAVRRGEIIKPSKCEKCKKATRLHGHHTDYSKPLDVMWLCPRCHLKEHERERETA